MGLEFYQKAGEWQLDNSKNLIYNYILKEEVLTYRVFYRFLVDENTKYMQTCVLRRMLIKFQNYELCKTYEEKKVHKRILQALDEGKKVEISIYYPETIPIKSQKEEFIFTEWLAGHPESFEGYEWSRRKI